MSESKRTGLDLLLAARNSGPATAAPLAAAEDDEEQARFYGYLRGIQDRAFNAEFRPAKGPWHVIEYSYLVCAEWRHAGEFVLMYASGHRVTVKGRRLRALFDRFRRHRVTYVRASDEDEVAPDSDLFVNEIDVALPDAETRD
jgi:hypothetical protein